MAKLIRPLSRLMVERLNHPGIDALSGSTGQGGNPFMQIRRNPQIKSAAEFPAGIHPVFGANFQKKLEGFPPFFVKRSNGIGLRELIDLK